MDMSATYKILVSAIVGLISWLIKDFVFGIVSKRNEQLRKEWEYRLKEVWSPLFYWSGVVLFNGKQKSWDKHGLHELELILVKSAHLLPLKHYYALIRVIEMESGQQTQRVNLSEITTTRDYIYKQIELLNYLLYRKKGIFDALETTDILSPYKTALRLFSVGAFHMLIWVIIVSVIIGMYLLYVKAYYWPLWMIALIFVVIIYVDIKKRLELHKEIKKRLK